VRPDAVDDLEAHGAFRNNKALHDKCVAMRTILLQHEARFRVNLRDAEAADPIFAQKLRDSGVNNSPSQMSLHFKRTAALKTDNTPLPLPPAPAGGIPFDDGRPAKDRERSWKTALAVGGGTVAIAGVAAVAANAAYHWVRGRHEDR
jgi:hypothetical protein